MARPKIQPDYNASQIMNDLINAVVESYEKTKVLKLTDYSQGTAPSIA